MLHALHSITFNKTSIRPKISTANGFFQFMEMAKESKSSTEKPEEKKTNEKKNYIIVLNMNWKLVDIIRFFLI